MTYICKTAFYDDAPVVEKFDDFDDARACFWETVRQREDLGIGGFGDAASITVYTLAKNGKRKVHLRKTFE